MGEVTIYLLILSLSGTRKFILYTGGEYGGSVTSTGGTTTVMRAGAKGSRRQGHPGNDTPLHPQLPYSASGFCLEIDTAFLCATDDTTDDDRRPPPPPPPRHRRRQTTDDVHWGVQEPRPAERSCGVSWRGEWRKGGWMSLS